MFMNTRIYTNSREAIIAAAIDLLTKEGSKGFTIEAVIRQSGLSKAGFFYNFKTKAELLLAVCEKLVMEWNEEVLKAEKRDKNPIGRSLRAQVKVAIDHFTDKKPGGAELNQALSELAVLQPEILQSYTKEFDKALIKAIEEGIPKAQTQMVALVLDGLWCQALLPTLSLKKNDLKQISSLLLKMTEAPIELTRPKGKK